MIELYDGYAVAVDEYGYTLFRHTGRYNKKTGIERRVIIGFYSTLAYALENLTRYLAKKQIEPKTVNIDEAIAIIHFEVERMQNFLKENLPEYEVVKK